MQEPLDQLTLEIYKNGKIKRVPALHPGWAESRVFVHFVPPPCPTWDPEDCADILEDLAAEQEFWLNRMSLLIKDLKWMLKLPHNRFWSQVTYDQKIHDCLTSFLSQAPRYFDPVNIYLTEEMNGCLQKISHFVFLIYIRMGTFKESKEYQITPQKFGEVIYDYFIFDIPKLMDLCVLFHQSNFVLLQKLVENIFKYQTKYAEDLRDIIPTIFLTLSNIETQLGITSNEYEEIKPIEDGFKHNYVTSLSWHDFQDAVFYLVDVTATLSAFVEVYPSSARVFGDNEVPIKIATFYEHVIPVLQNELRHRMSSQDFKYQGANLQERLALIRSSLLKVFRCIVFYCCLHPVVSKSDNYQTENVQVYLEDYMQMMMTVVTEKSFISDYQKKFPVENDVEIFHTNEMLLDATRFQYILDIYSAANNNSKKQIKLTEGKKRPKQNLQENGSSSNYEESYGDGACASAIPSDVELDSLVTQVKDLLPDLGDGFIEASLEYFNYNSETVINAVLENVLPKCLSQLDRNSKSKRLHNVEQINMPARVGHSESFQSRDNHINPSILSERRNVFDHDEFDVFNRNDIDRTKIFRGKRPTVPKKREFLNDKSHIKDTKNVYEKYNIVIDNVEVSGNDLYDDEYDDTYDENGIGASEPDKMEQLDEMLSVRPFVTPRVLEKPSVKEEKVSSKNGHEESPEESEEPPRDCFVPNPEELRRKAEERRQQKMQQRRPPPPQFQNQSNGNRDVKGNPKGQGQDENVLKNRNFKERHKSSRANHNRKGGSDWKRSRGMIPS